MKVLMVHPGPDFSVADVHRGYYRALIELGCQVVDMNYRERLSFYSNCGRIDDNGAFQSMVDDVGSVRLASKGILAVCYEYQPDVVIIVSGFFVPLDVFDTIRAHGTKVVVLHTESPYEDDKQMVRACHADLNVLNDPTNINHFKAIAPTIYLPHAYDPAVHYPAPVSNPAHVSVFCFVGTGYPARIRFLEAIDWAGVDIALAGNWQYLTGDSPLRKFLAHDFDDCCDNDETADLYRGSKMSCNLYRKEAEREGLVDGWSMGPREVEMAACGLFYSTEARGENREILPMLPTFTEPAELADQVRWYLDHPDLREILARKARAAITGRTFAANAAALLQHL